MFVVQNPEVTRNTVEYNHNDPFESLFLKSRSFFQNILSVETTGIDSWLVEYIRVTIPV